MIKGTRGLLRSVFALEVAARVLPFLVFLLVYGPAVGHGFISDDFNWLTHSRIDGWSDIARIFGEHVGFYRPVVSLSFGLDYGAFGFHALGFGLTNLGLALLCAALLYALMRRLGLPDGASLLGSALWLLNFHGISMAVLWISGRTSLLLTSAALASALALTHRRFLVAGLFLLLALFSKEEAIALPLIFAIWLAVFDKVGASQAKGLRVMFMWILISAVALAAYFVLRIQSGAITMNTAPSFYRLTLTPAPVATNVLHYADRAGTWPAVTILLSFILLRPRLVELKPSRALLFMGLAWALGGYAITVFLPVRSSLYACFPSIGTCLIAAEVCRSLWVASPTEPRRRALLTAALIPIFLIPVYWTRNRRWVDLADFSNRFLPVLVANTQDLPDKSLVVLVDPETTRTNIGSAIGGFVEQAYTQATGRSMRFSVVHSDADAASGMQCDNCVARLLILNGSNLVRHVAPDTR